MHLGLKNAVFTVKNKANFFYKNINNFFGLSGEGVKYEISFN